MKLPSSDPLELSGPEAEALQRFIDECPVCADLGIDSIHRAHRLFYGANALSAEAKASGDVLTFGLAAIALQGWTNGEPALAVVAADYDWMDLAVHNEDGTEGVNFENHKTILTVDYEGRVAVAREVLRILDEREHELN